MPTSDKPGFPDGCHLCDRAAGLLHHISYEPEIVVLLCSDCHGTVHSMGFDGTPRHPGLHPKMSRKQWEKDNWNGTQAPRPTAEQIEWADQGKGHVQR